jgi:tungstate transport system ATP-binding protein
MISLQAASVVIDSRTCIDNMTLAVEQEGITVVIGANGSGKTLLLRLIAGLLHPTNGQLIMAPQPRYSQINRSPFTYPNISYVPSTPVLLDRSVWDNILLPLRIQAKNQPDQLSTRSQPLQQSQQAITPEGRAQAALQWANIESIAQQAANSLSSGQQQLVALARAWALSPQLLLIDEPCANLDPNRQQHSESLILGMQAQCKIIMSSHNIRQAERLANDVVFLDEGKLLAHLPSKSFFNRSSDDILSQKIDTFIRYA